MNLRDYTSSKDRRKALEEKLAINLSHIGRFSFDESVAAKKNCENMIGAIQVPVGVAGPILVHSSQFSVHSYYIPLATTEGALVASVNRGCRAITESGGVTVMTKKIGITRAPVFVVDNLLAGKECSDWVEKNLTALQKIAESTSRHVHLLEIKPFLVGRNVFLRFRFDTQDAMGMNMATIATAKVAEYIEQKTSAKLIALSGNLCVDKKPNALNFIEGRGISVWAEAKITQDIVTQVLKTTVEDITAVAERKLYLGSIISHSIGANAHIANVLAAMFLATGQDIAHVAECSTGISSVEKKDGGLYISVYLPDLVSGTIGGGTELDSQKEALSILGVAGGNNGDNAVKYAEIIGAAVLAGELSLLASLAENSLAIAHQKLGRGK